MVWTEKDSKKDGEPDYPHIFAPVRAYFSGSYWKMGDKYRRLIYKKKKDGRKEGGGRLSCVRLLTILKRRNKKQEGEEGREKQKKQKKQGREREVEEGNTSAITTTTTPIKIKIDLEPEITTFSKVWKTEAREEYLKEKEKKKRRWMGRMGETLL